MYTIPVPPQTEIVFNGYFHTVYGWTRNVVTDHDRSYPMKECLGVYSWRWVAERCRRRWLATVGK